MGKKRIVADYDAEYDILKVGYEMKPASYGKERKGGYTVFHSLADESIVGIEVDGYKAKIDRGVVFDDDIPFASTLNAQTTKDLAVDDCEE